MAIRDNELALRSLNPDTLGENPKGTEAMRDAFARHKDDKTLFAGPQGFVRKWTRQLGHGEADEICLVLQVARRFNLAASPYRP